MAKFFRVPTNSSCLTRESIGEKEKKRLYALRCPTKKKYKGHMLVSETSAAAVFPLTRFRGLARLPSSAKVPEVAYPCLKLFDQWDPSDQ